MFTSEFGSKIARNGFQNENEIVNKFNNWENDQEARSWLILMNYQLNEIEYVKAIKLSGYKTDVQVQVTIKLKDAIDIENLQVKLVSNQRGYNQIDKRWVERYSEMWNMPRNILDIFKRYTGEVEPSIKAPKDKRRMFANEFSDIEQIELLNWLKENQTLIVSDVLRGSGKFAAEWMLVVQKISRNAKWTLKSMNFCLNYFGNGEICITKRGNIRIGKITVQRKGGDGGRVTSKMLQFKINPAELFNFE